MRKFLILIFMIITLVVSLSAEDQAYTSPPDYLLKSTMNQTTRTIISVGNWVYWQYSNGLSAHSPDGEDGGYYPQNIGPVIYTDGLLYGGLINGNLNEYRIGGVAFDVGLQAGWINNDGSAADPNDERVKIWRIRDDWRTLTYSQVKFDAMHLNELKSLTDVSESMCQEVIDQYEEDWNNWPVDLGAPYYDADGNGTYNPDADGDGNLGEKADSLTGQIEEDRPGLANADQVIWYAANDLNKNRTTDLYGTDPVGIEVQVTMWAYDQPSSRIGQIVFKRYKMINKSSTDMTDMYVTQWSDPDIGSSGNDFIGCNPDLGLGYAYNGETTDPEYLEVGVEAPPSVGYDFFQGPLVDGKAGEDLNKNGVDDAQDYGLKEFKQVGPGKINLPMTSFSWFARGSVIADPTKHELKGARQFYNLMRGYQPTEELDDPVPWNIGNMGSQPETMFPLSGDPVNDPTNIDVDGNGQYLPPGDRRMCLNSGPFHFAVGDTQEIVVAVVGGHGGTNINSITEMNMTDDIAQQIFNSGFTEIPKPPASPMVVVSTTESQIMLDWSSAESITNTENNIIAGYAFEGYNVYQLPRENAPISEARKLACYDLVNEITTIYERRYIKGQYEGSAEVPIQSGNDSGIKRYLEIKTDSFTGAPIIEGKYYYFAVTAYSFNGAAKIVKTLESPPIVYSVRVEEAAPGEIKVNIGDFVDFKAFSANENWKCLTG